MEVNGRQNSVLRRFVDDGWDYMSSKKPGPPTHKLHPQINPGPVHHDEEKKDIKGRAVRSVDGSSVVRSLDHKNQQTSISASDSDSRDHGLATPRIGSTLAAGSSNSNNFKDSGSGSSRIIKKSTDEVRNMAEKDFEIRRVFNTYDEDRDGRISEAELGNCMKKLDLDVSEDAILTMMSSVDKNGDGLVDFDEFLALQQTPTSANNYSNGTNSTHHGKTQSKNSSSTTTSLEYGDDDPDGNDTLLKETFSIFDKNHDGFISNIELQSILHRLGIRKGSSLKDCQQMIAGVDRNGDGRVDFEEFKELMTDLL
ncbi:hypothetical protein CY35_17G085100 [Sphagnum magellanicum]|jgi:calcium-binding protein CML|nr:hypothetical protein CY35_17G085100 [Sphagnum magellanicum]